MSGLLALLGAPLEAKWGFLTVPHPLFVLAVWGPAIAALSTVASFDGRAGLAAYLRRVVRWRDGSFWYAVVILGWPAALVLCRVLSGLPALPESFFSGAPAVIANALALLILDAGPMEEVGWRGYALPLLQQRFSALTASLLLGAVWGLWHLPGFYIAGATQQAYLFVAFLLGSIVLSVVMTSLYNATRGCIPLMYVFHWGLNDPFALGKREVQVALFGAMVAVAVLSVVLARGRARFVEEIPRASEGSSNRT